MLIWITHPSGGACSGWCASPPVQTTTYPSGSHCPLCTLPTALLRSCILLCSPATHEEIVGLFRQAYEQGEEAAAATA